MRTWIGTGITLTMRSTRPWDCRWGVAWSRVPVSGSSNSASRVSGCGGVRTVSTISCTSGSPGSTDALRPCSVWPCPRTCECARPNPIGPDDFVGWVQERGLFFAHSWDERYKPVFRVADPGELPLLGGLLVARYGRGRYVYTGLAFFRQLPAGVPGAYRLFANLIGDGNSQCTILDNS